MKKTENIGIIKTDNYYYPSVPPFRPSKKYPEYRLHELSSENHVYDMIRNGFYLMGYDNENWNTPAWNPLGEFIMPGQTVVIKPNMVMDVNPSGDGTDCLFTHPSLVACVVDYVAIALKNEGKIVIGDAPMQECNFENLINNSGYNVLLSFYQSIFPESLKIELIDFRGLHSSVHNGVYHSEEVNTQNGTVVDLGYESEFAGLGSEFFKNIRITNYDPQILKSHHDAEKNEYYVSNAVLQADVIINMPKPKTHRKAGVTIALKNLVGINARKEYLPHHTKGDINSGGDEYKNKSYLKEIKDYLLDKKNYYQQTKKNYAIANIIEKNIIMINILLKYFSKDQYFEGSWYGNNTISRTIVDLNKILMYADKNGNISNVRQRKLLIIADMIVSGEKEGPVIPSAKNVGIIAIGENPVVFDEIIATLMGAKLEYINTIKHARKPQGTLNICDEMEKGTIVSNDVLLNGKNIDNLEKKSILYFIPANGWTVAFKKRNES